MKHSLKRELYQFLKDLHIEGNDEMNERKNELCAKVKDSLNQYDITCVERLDFEDRAEDPDGITDEEMEAIAEKMCDCYLNNGGFYDDAWYAAEQVGIKMLSNDD